jgi:LDH2 family malate/lactate/ureidoglycolate dehydrogenase
VALTPLGGIGEDLGGYKGYGYATAIEILSAALAHGQYLKALTGMGEDGKPRPYWLGHFFLAMDVSAFIDPDDFKKTSGDILRAIRASEKMPGQERIYTAGEKEYIAWLDRKDRGVPLNESLQETVKGLQSEFGLTEYAFDW